MPQQLQLLNSKEIESLPTFQSSPPDNIVGQCTNCGKCCTTINCLCLDPVSLKCKVYVNRPMACRIWPQDGHDISSTGCTGFNVHGL